MLSALPLIRGFWPLRAIILSLTLLSSIAHAGTPVVLQRPISLDTGTGELFGTLLLPKSPNPVPVVLIIAGSGPTDRDGNNSDGGRNDSMKRLALILAKHNIASVRYDKRGVAASRPATPDERDLSIEKYVDDAVAWSAKLKTDPRLGPLILMGHSEGALVATLAAERAGAVALISVAGTGRPVDQVVREQLQDRLPPALLARSEQLIEEIKAGKTDSDVPEPLQVVFRPSVQPYLISLFRQNPTAAFGQLKIPTLIIQGRNDMQVGVGDAELLHKAKPDSQLAIIDGMNHVLRIVPMDIKRQLASYKDPQLPLASEVTDRILKFLDSVPAA
ncbi:alpha/beta hydrolase [Pseudomonas petrae]|uniref:Lysophospholipase n=1 Tax=Pseudomonas petrae TaxID=2912190 RepID=A0ABS9IAL8_9PSED|nr:alpha/beta fold hydrolase [Pseudomonas petrae]MCF7535281.1 lysophospholipase [Pseudomonas petrae]MCF7540453.1 lysophospholipase [Pseudomonas petrae]MCF7544457.1 lysophospholipase [Pseudomonas petrae]MCF7558487.1 lysophospholipase [Pseudomonas petrae]